MLQVQLPDGSEKQYETPLTARDIVVEIGPRLAKAALAAMVDDRVVSLDDPLPDEGRIALRILTKKDAEALDVMRHSCAHIMARAVMRLARASSSHLAPR